MLFNSYHFLIFFPMVLCIYYIFPMKYRYLWLLVSSYYFYMCWNAKYAILLFISTFATYLSGIFIELIRKKIEEEKRKNRYMKICVASCFTVNIAILAWFKYFNFIFDSISSVLLKVGIEISNPNFDIILPVGISFYTFQALSYTMDIYRGEIYAEKNIFKYALFVSFFPQLVAGPIERSKNLLKQISVPRHFDYNSCREGFLLMIWGFFVKLVISDRAAIVVNTVYNNYEDYPGVFLIIATILFAVQIYCDFGGYSIIAMGAAKMLGFGLMDNFNCPYFASSVSDFWRRWHISLSSWFKDYLYIPLGGNRKGKIRKYVNLMIVFIVSGVWHGAQWTFVIWGAINGGFQVIGELIKPVKDYFNKIFKRKDNAIGNKFLKIIITFVLINITWIFFRANSLDDAFRILKSIFTTENWWVLFDDSLFTLGLSWKNMILLVFAIQILIIADILKYRGIKVREIIIEQELWCRWLIYLVGIFATLIFGIWGAGYDASAFIYFQF